MKRVLALILIVLLLISPLPSAWAEEGSGVAAPTATPTPEGSSQPADQDPTPAPDPTPTPDPAIRFVPEEGLPLPQEGYALTEKRAFAFGGTVVSGVPLSRVSVAVSDGEGNILLHAEAEPDEADESALSFPLWDRTYPFVDESLSGQMDFAALKPGTYTFTLQAANAIVGETVLYSSPFTVERTTAVHTLIPNDLRGTYPAAEAYLGDGALPFTYQTGTYGQIWVNSGWTGRNIVSIATPFGTWRVNKAAQEPFNQAVGYLRTAYVHVGGRWDSGILRLSRLVRSWNGPFIGRTEEGSPFLSPHVLGLAVDLNAGMGPNAAVPDNWATFCKEISENLIYNGIREKNGYRYYDFTYIGNWGTTYERVPTIIVNYLLYELAFYRAGFFWGVYYDHTCDAAHFGLGEYDPSVHTDSPLALRKVFEYIGE